MRARLSNLIYRLLIGISITSIGGASALLIYDYVDKEEEIKNKKLIYTCEAEKKPFSYKGNIIDRNRIDYIVHLENVGSNLVDPTPIHISFRNKDAKIVAIYPFLITYKYKERHMPPSPLILPEPAYPYLPDGSILAEPLNFYKLPHILERMDKMIDENLSRKEILKEIIIYYDKELVSIAHQTYFENLPMESFELDTYVEPMEHGDIGEFAFSVSVQNIDVFVNAPPIFLIESKLPQIKIVESKESYLDVLATKFPSFLDHIFHFFLISVAINFVLALSFVRKTIVKKRKV